ncbi:hypothetical protein G3M55_12100 [Streptomyces sp. SID8455]|nr:hypothetical protein [Streptomyces sp. SID8455]
MLRTGYGGSDLRGFAGGFMIPESAGEGTVLEGGEEFVEGSEVLGIPLSLLPNYAGQLPELLL